MKKLLATLFLLPLLLFSGCDSAEENILTVPPTEPEPTALSTNITTVNPDGSVQRMEQVYDENGTLVQLNHHSGANLLVSYAVTCNENGDPVKMVDESFGTGVSMVYTYNEQGQPLKTETLLDNEPYLIQTYSYYSDGTQSAYAVEDKRTDNLCETRYLYENGLQVSEEFYDNGIVLYTWKYTYDSEGRRSVDQKFDENGVADGSRKYTYTPDCTTVTALDVQGQAVSVKQLYYDSLGQLIKEILTVDGQVTTTEYTYLPQKETQ